MTNGHSDEAIADLVALRDRLREFAAERDWDQFHSPRNLATALIVEAAELLEHFQWGALEEGDIGADRHAAIEQEVADVLIYLVRLADRLDIDLLQAAAAKIRLNESKYPVEMARGKARKYTEL